MPQSNERRRQLWAENPEKYRAAQRRHYRANPEARKRHSWKAAGAEMPTRPCPVVCESCGRPTTDGRALSLDHDHETGKFRGWLCQKCNAALGFLADSEAYILALHAYLMRAKS
jgi:hypothetical protein